MNSAKIIYNVIDQSFSPVEGVKGVSGFMGIFKRGPVGQTDEVFSNWPAFKKRYGGLIAESDAPLLAKRALERGAKLRICGIRHFTDITDPTAVDADFAGILATKIYTLSIAPATGHTVTYTIGADTVSQVFTTSALNTLNLLAGKILAQWPNQVDHVHVSSTTRLQITLLTGTGTLAATGAGAPTVTATTMDGFVETGGTELFEITPKYPGLDYNNIRAYVTAASNGNGAYFNLAISMAGESDYPVELYENLRIVGAPTVAASTYLDDAKQRSELVNFTYKDLSALASPIVPLTNHARMTGGTDGGTVTATDYIGDAAGKNGFHAFDMVSGILAIGADTSLDAVAIAGAAYAGNRKDLQYIHHFDNDLVTTSTIISNKVALNIDSQYIQFWTGGLNVLNPLNNIKKDISAIGDILGASALSEIQAGAWYSFAGPRRGWINNAFGVVNNFGGTPDLTSLDLLANYQINAVVNAEGEIGLSGNFSGQLATSHLSFNNVVRLIIFLKGMLRPILKEYIEEPNDFKTWKEIYLNVKGPLDSLKDRRAIFDYQWQGDQFVTKLEDLVINNANDVGVGKYKVKLFVKDIVSMQEISIDIIITQSGVSFEDSLSLLGA